MTINDVCASGKQQIRSYFYFCFGFMQMLLSRVARYTMTQPFSVQNRFLDGIFRQCFRSTECESIKRKPQISVSANTIFVARRVIFEFHFCLRTESRDGKKGEEKKRFAEWSLGSGHCVRYTWCTNKINDFRFLEHFSAGSERTEQRYTKANYKIHNSICWM